MPKTVDLAELERLLEAGAQLVEVLPPAEYAEEHIPGAINIPLKSMDHTTVASLDRDTPVVLYCYDAL